MRSFLLAMLLCFLTFAPDVVGAETPDAVTPAPAAVAAPAKATPAPAVDASIDLDKDGKVSAEETKALVDKDASVGDVVKEGSAALDAAKDLKGKSGKSLALALAIFLAALFKMLLSTVKVASKSTDWFKTKRGKYSTLVLGGFAAAGAGAAAMMGVPFDWMDIAVVGLSGPGSMIAHELSALLPGVGKHTSPEA